MLSRWQSRDTEFLREVDQEQTIRAFILILLTVIFCILFWSLGTFHFDPFCSGHFNLRVHTFNLRQFHVISLLIRILGHITGASIYPRCRRSLETAFPGKRRFPASTFSVNKIISYNTAKNRSNSLGIQIIVQNCCFCVTYRVIFNLSRAFFARYFLNWKKYNRIYNTADNTRGKYDRLYSFKIYIFITFYLKYMKLVITPQLPPGKIGKHCVVLKPLTCPAERVLTK